MKPRYLLAALATTCITLFQACDSSVAATPAAGDRSSQGKGMVAFRMSPGTLKVLQSQGTSFRIEVGGPGMETTTSYQAFDTIAYAYGIPCGTRYVKVSVVNLSDSMTSPTWTGIDTVEVNPDQFAYAHIVLHRTTPPNGNIVIELTLDSGRIDTSFWHVDTLFRDTLVNYPVSDSSYHCYLSWASTTASHFECLRMRSISIIDTMPPYRPYPDTMWVDSLVSYPVDSTPHCYPSSLYSDSGAATTCTRLVYRPIYDTFPSVCSTFYLNAQYVSSCDTTGIYIDTTRHPSHPHVQHRFVQKHRNPRPKRNTLPIWIDTSRTYQDS